jgi:ABC-type branched-subunit amino acid transport system substrate-binding protein
MINDQGGVNGRKITMLSVDDGFSPPKTVEQTRKLIEEDGVLAIVGSLGTATNGAVQK